MVALGSRISDAPQSRFDTVVEWLVGIILVFSPLAFGATQAWSQEILLGLVAVTALCVAAKFIWDWSERVVWSWAYLFIAIFLLLSLGQVLKLPSEAIGRISPNTVDLKRSLLSDLPDASGFLNRITISFYPAAGWVQMRLIVAVSAMFIIVLHIYRDPRRIKRLLLIIATVGLAVALLAVYQNVSGTTWVYGIVPAVHRNSGPFMNYSHFGQFMNLSVGAALGLLLVKIVSISQRHRTMAGTIEEFREPRHWILWALAITCILGPITVFLAMTRMGMLSLMAAGALSGVMIAWRSPTGGKASFVFALGILVFACLLYAGFDAIYDRLATLRHLHGAQGGRLQMLHDMLAEFRLFPLLGTGLGTHEFIFPMFDHSNIVQIATHAENEYAQLFEECGIIGLVLALGFLGLVVANYLKAVWRPKEPIQYAAFGLGFGLLAILIHSGSDFGQHVPANALLTAISAALLFNLARRPWMVSAIAQPAGRLWGLRFALPVILIGLFSSALLFADRARRAEMYDAKAQLLGSELERNGWQGSNSDYVALLGAAETATRFSPNNIKYRYYLNLYRWHAISRSLDANAQAMMQSPAVLGFASRIVNELESSRKLCPCFGPPVALAGELNLSVLNKPVGEDQIRRAYKLTPWDRTICFLNGMLDVQQGNWEHSLVTFRRSIAMGESARDVTDAYIQGGRPDLAYQITQGDRTNLQYLSAALTAKATDPQLARQCQREATDLLVNEARQPGASPEVLAELANIYARQGAADKAIDLYRQALNLDYGHIEWRMQLAQLLANGGQYDDAVRELRVCVRLRPQLAQAQSLLASYTPRTSAAAGGDVSGQQ